jgi:hypothetical protein
MWTEETVLQKGLFVTVEKMNILKVLSSEMLQESRLGSKSLCCKTILPARFLFEFKGTPSRKEHKTGFSVVITIDLNLLIKFTNPANDGLCTFSLRNHESQASSKNLQAMSYDISYKLRAAS